MTSATFSRTAFSILLAWTSCAASVGAADSNAYTTKSSTSTNLTARNYLRSARQTSFTLIVEEDQKECDPIDLTAAEQASILIPSIEEESPKISVIPKAKPWYYTEPRSKKQTNTRSVSSVTEASTQSATEISKTSTDVSNVQSSAGLSKVPDSLETANDPTAAELINASSVGKVAKTTLETVRRNTVPSDVVPARSDLASSHVENSRSPIFDRYFGKLTSSSAETLFGKSTLSSTLENASDLLIVDSDEQTAPETDNGQGEIAADSQVESGTKFPIRMLSSHTTKSAVIGDTVEAVLDADIRIGSNVVAPKGSKVIGRVSSCEHSRKFLASLTPSRKARMSASIGIQFDTIVTPAGARLPITAKPATEARIIDNRSTGRILGVNDDGSIAPPLSSQVKAQALAIGIRAGASAAGPVSFGAVPVGFAIMGAVKPSLFLLRPVGTNEPHRRLKGFGLGFLNGLPGGFVVADCIVRGGEVNVLPGDRMQAQFNQVFTGNEKSSEEVALELNKKEVRGNVIR